MTISPMWREWADQANRLFEKQGSKKKPNQLGWDQKTVLRNESNEELQLLYSKTAVFSAETWAHVDAGIFA